jgi:hypothetical protein
VQDRQFPLEVITRLLAGMEQDRNGCWLWTRGRIRAGYGLLRVDGRPRYAHRLAYMVFRGSIAADMGDRPPLPRAPLLQTAAPRSCLPRRELPSRRRRQGQREQAVLPAWASV